MRLNNALPCGFQWLSAKEEEDTVKKNYVSARRTSCLLKPKKRARLRLGKQTCQRVENVVAPETGT